jgi:hypothetical protein
MQPEHERFELHSRLRRLGLAASALAALLGTVRAQSVVTYDASSGTFPESPCWKLVDTASPENPLVQGGALVLSTSAASENMHYLWESSLFFPSTLVFEARLKLVSGSSTSSVRAPLVLGFTLSPAVGNSLFVDHDQIFVLASNTVKGASAVVDTNDAFHTYRIEVTGTSAGSLLEVYYDAETTPRIQDVLIDDSSVNGPVPRLYFGEGSVLAFGTGEWQLVSHNAGPASCCGQVNSCGNLENLLSQGVVTGGTYSASSGGTWDIVLGGVPAAPSPGLLIYGFGPSNPATPVGTSFGNLCLSPFFRAVVAVPGSTAGGCASPSQYVWTNWAAFVTANKSAGAQGFSMSGTDEVWLQAWHRDPPNPGAANLSKIVGPFFVTP